MIDARFSRQVLFDAIGSTGQEAIRRCAVVLVGLGAVGAAAAEMLARAGVDRLFVVDRDIVEESNLHRQTLYDAADASEGRPKVEAACRRLADIGVATRIGGMSADIVPERLDELCRELRARGSLLFDASDNFETRYLLNDLAVREGVALVYAGAIGAVASAGVFVPGTTPCVRCLFPEPPPAGSVATCDTAGVIGPAAHAAADMAVAMLLRHVVGDARHAMVTVDLWNDSHARVALTDGRVDPACAACATRRFPALEARPTEAVRLCGRDVFQVHPPGAPRVDLAALVPRLLGLGRVRVSDAALRLEMPSSRLVLFSDGRALVSGVDSAERARTLYAQVVGS